MSVIYATTLKNTRMDSVNTAIGASGKLVIGTSALSGATGVLATLPLDAASAFGSSANGVITLDCTPALSAAATAAATAGAPAAKAEFRTSGDAVVISGLTVGVTGSGANIELAAVEFGIGVTVTITAGSITHG